MVEKAAPADGETSQEARASLNHSMRSLRWAKSIAPKSNHLSKPLSSSSAGELDNGARYDTFPFS